MIRRPIERGDEGFTLPELLVSITLLAIVSAAIVASTVAIQRNLGVANATMNDLAANRIGIERVGQLLRGAVSESGELSRSDSPVEVGESGRVVFLSLTGQDLSTSGGLGVPENPIRVELRVIDQGGSQVLEERITDPRPLTGTNPTWPATPDRVRVIVRDLVDPVPATAEFEMFQYLSHFDGQGAADDADRCGRSLTIPLDATGRQDVDSVSYTISSRGPSGYDNTPITLSGYARFASTWELGYSDAAGGQGCLDDDGAFSYAP